MDEFDPHRPVRRARTDSGGGVSDATISRAEIARGAGLVGLSRAASLIEAVAQPLFIWMYGLAA